MAGLPNNVINRAEAILVDLEKTPIDSIEPRKTQEDSNTIGKNQPKEDNSINKVDLVKASEKLKAEVTAEDINYQNDKYKNHKKHEEKEHMQFMQVAEMPTLFGVSISNQLKELDLMSMTPLDAMNKLYELQQQAKQEE